MVDYLSFILAINHIIAAGAIFRALNITEYWYPPNCSRLPAVVYAPAYYLGEISLHGIPVTLDQQSVQDLSQQDTNPLFPAKTSSTKAHEISSGFFLFNIFKSVYITYFVARYRAIIYPCMLAIPAPHYWQGPIMTSVYLAWPWPNSWWPWPRSWALCLGFSNFSLVWYVPLILSGAIKPLKNSVTWWRTPAFLYHQYLPTTILGYAANNGIIGSVLGLVMTGCLFAI